jgi:hypothetical protein
MPDSPPARKPPLRFWLYAPFGLLVIGIVLWSLVWLAVSAEVIKGMDDAAQSLRAKGWQVAWTDRRVDGYPFRIDVTVDNPSLREPSGWGFAAPGLKAQAYAYNLDNWIVVAPSGLTLQRPTGGAVAITGLLRASFAGFERSPPRVAVEGVDLAFAPQPGGAPFFLTRAANLGLFIRPFEGGQVEAALRYDGGQSAPNTLLGRLTSGRPSAMIGDVLISQAAALTGPDSVSAIRAWSAAGGHLQIVRWGLAGDGAWLGVTPTSLSVDANGRLSGDLSVVAHDAPRAIRALGQGGGTVSALAAEGAADLVAFQSGGAPTARFALRFEDGMTKVGPIPIVPAPKFY